MRTIVIHGIIGGMDTVIMQIGTVPKRLRDEFKALCVLRGTTMQDEIIRLIQQEVKKGEERK